MFRDMNIKYFKCLLKHLVIEIVKDNWKEQVRDRHANVWSDPLCSSIGSLYIHVNKLERQLKVSVFFLSVVVSSSLNLMFSLMHMGQTS